MQNNFVNNLTISLRQLLITTKRFLLKPSLWILIILMPVFSFSIHQVESTDNSSPIIAYCIDGAASNKSDAKIIEKHIEKYEGYFSFVQYDDIEEIKDLVAKSKIQCGYVIPANLFEKMADGRKKNLITCLTGSDTTLSYISDEVLYSLLFPEISKRNLVEYLMEDSKVAEDIALAEIDYDTIADLFDKYVDEVQLTANYIPLSEIDNRKENIRQQEIEDKDDNNGITILSSSLRGLLAILINLSAVFGVLDYYHMNSAYIRNKKRMAIFSIAVPSFLLSISALVSLYLSDNFTSIFKELLAVVFYIIILVTINFILLNIIKGPAIFYSLLPFYLLASVIFVPILIDISGYVASLKPLSAIFLPNYYMMFF